MKALKEAVLEMFRVMVIATIPVIIASLENGNFIIDWQAVAIVAVITGLRFIDKYLHELGKERESKTLTKGLTRF
jgi:hypothetical protein